MNKILFLFCLVSSFAQSQVEKTPYPMEKSSLLWEISGNNLDQPSYLFGTMHLIEKEYFIFPKKLKKTLLKSDVLVMELEGVAEQANAMEHLFLRDGRTFFDFFNAAETDSIYTWAKEKLSIDSAMFKAGFSQMKPFVVSQLALQMSFAGKTESYELSFEELAKKEGMERKGLETMAFQMSLFDNLTDEQQSEMIMEGIRQPDAETNLITRMMQMYSRQQIDSLYMMMEDEGGAISEEQATFLDKRNQNWIPLIEDIIQKKRAFIAVGAGHLGGPNGVIRLLEDEGYSLKPIKL